MESMLTVTVYADTTGLFTEEQIDWLLDGPSIWGNICDILVPESIVREWYEKYCEDDETFEEWFHEIYTCDDTDGLYEFAAERMGENPQLAESRYNDSLKHALEDLEERKRYKGDEKESVEDKAKALLDSLGITYDEEEEERLENFSEQYSY